MAKSVNTPKGAKKAIAPVIDITQIQSGAPGEIKRGRGRPPKDPNAPPKEKTPLAHNFNMGGMMVAMDIDMRLISKSHDNMQSTHLGKLGNRTVMIYEHGDVATIFVPQMQVKRKMSGLMKALEAFEVNVDEDEDIE